MVVGGGGGASILKAFYKQWYTHQIHVEFTFNNQMIPHTCISIIVSNNE